MDFSKLKSLTIPDGNVVQIEAGGKVLWKAGPLPSAYQQVEWIRNSAPTSTSSGAYLDLGFAFDTAAVVHLNFIVGYSSGQPFGAAENSGVLRCMISQTATGGYTIYGSDGSKYLAESISGLGEEVNLVYTLKKGVVKMEDLITGKVSNSYTTTNANFTMTRNLYLFAQNYNTAARFAGTYTFKGFKYYDKNGDLICDLIPCYRKSDGVIGMYDVVRKIFLTNAGSGSFTKGADV